MPFGDGTGPLGQGPRTGRRAGFCSGFGVPGSFSRGGGFSVGGRVGGRGWKNRFFSQGFPAGREHSAGTSIRRTPGLAAMRRLAR